MKLGYHSEIVNTATVALIQAAGHVPILLTLDLDPGRLAAIRPYVGLLIGRVYIADETPYLGHGAQLAQHIATRVAPVAHLLDGVCCLNEPDVSTPEKAAVVAQTIIDAASLLHAAGLRIVAGNFSTGTPALESDPNGGAILDALVSALHEITLGPGGYLGLHEYGAPSMHFEAGYLCGRYAKLLDALGTRGCHVPALISECGIDFGHPDAPSGYAANGVSDDAYLADLQWYAGLVEADPRVVAAAVFEAGSYDAFASFDICRTGLGGRLAQWMGQQSRQDGPSGPGKGNIVTDYAPATWAPSPYFWPGRNGAAIRAIVPHGTAGPGAVSWFQDPNADPKVSAHYVVEEDGTVTQCVAEENSAWHAGVVTADSAYAGGDNPNHWTIGIEHTRDVKNESPITGPQLAASLALVRDILRRHGPLSFILHDQIDVGRVCPGPGFPLPAFQALLTPPAPPTVALAIPLDNQLTSDGPNKYNECGSGCMRMICDYFGIDRGESIDAIDVDETGDEQYVGYTTTNQMVAWFTARGVPAVQAQPQGTAAAIRTNLARGWPCVYLGVWDRAALTGGHFEVPVAAGPDGITFNNPYGGFRETLSDADVDRYSLGWLVTVQQERKPTVDDTLKAAAVARFSALGIQPNPDGALFKAYARMVAAWLASGQDSVLDPTPAIRPEAVTPDGQHAYLLLDSGRLLHWRKDTGLVYQAEYKELPAIFKTTGWPLPQAA